MRRAKITIVTVCYNAVATIEKTILSVINQSYNDIEYIIIDGGSTDGTTKIINKYQENIDYYVSESDKGIYDAMNKGICAATGEWVNFMNSGDVFFDLSTLQEVNDQIAQHSSVDIFYGEVAYNYSFGQRIKYSRHIEHLKHDMVFSHQSCFIRTDLMKKNLYNLKYKYSADYDCLLNLYLKGWAFFHIPLVVSAVEVDKGATYDNFLFSKIDVYYIHRKNFGQFFAILKFINSVPVLYMKKMCKSIFPSVIIAKCIRKIK